MGSEQSDNKPATDMPKINHPRFQNVKFVKDNEIMQTTMNLDNYNDFEEWEQNLNKVAKFDDEVILLPKAYSCTRKAICGSAAVLNIQYDNYSFILQSQLDNRFNLRKHFSEEEIWYLLSSLVKAATDFQTLNVKIGDVRPDNIFLSDDGQIKVSNLFSWPCESTNYEKTIFDKELTYLAPEEIEGTKEGKTETFIDKYKAESFSIGLTVLETALLDRCSILYDPKSNIFDREELRKLLKKWWQLSYEEIDEETGQHKQCSYSQELKLAVAAMCDIDAEERLTSSEVNNWLEPFQQHINSLKKFECGLPKLENMKKYEQFLRRKVPETTFPRKLQGLNIESKNKNINVVINGRPVTYGQGAYSIPQYPRQYEAPKFQPLKDYGMLVGGSQQTSEPKPYQPPSQPSYPTSSSYQTGTSYDFFKKAASTNPYPNSYQPATTPPNIPTTTNFALTQLPATNPSYQSPTFQNLSSPPPPKPTSTDDFLKRIDEALQKSRLNNPI